MRIGFGGLAALGAALLLGPAAGAAAGTVPAGWEERPRSLRLSLGIPASHGYEMQLETRGHRQVTLQVIKGGSLASYRTTGRVSRAGIEAEFGSLGRISVRFDGKPKPRFRWSPADLGLPPDFFGGPCRGRRTEREVGRFRGTIRFEGERGYARIEARRAQGEMVRSYRRLCKRGRVGPGLDLEDLFKMLPPIRAELLAAGGESSGRRTFFSIVKLDARKALGGGASLGTVALGGSEERREGMRINHLLMLAAGAKALRASPSGRQPATATVALGKPFEGRADLVQAPQAPVSWSGSLLVRLPGLGAVPLTGPGIDAVLCRTALFDEVRTPCLKRAESLNPPSDGSPAMLPGLLQLSGSHSQALAELRLSISRYARNWVSSSGSIP